MRRSSLSVFGAEGSSKLAIAAHGPSHAPARTASTRAHGPRRLHRRLPRRLPRRQGCPAGISRRSLRRLHGTPRVVLPSAACVHAAVRACALVPARLGGGRACAAAGPGYAAAGPGYPGRKWPGQDDDHAAQFPPSPCTPHLALCRFNVATASSYDAAADAVCSITPTICARWSRRRPPKACARMRATLAPQLAEAPAPRTRASRR